MRKRSIGVMAIAMLLIVGLIAPASAVIDDPGGDFGLCGDLEWIKYDWKDGWVKDSSPDAPIASITLDETLDEDDEPVSVYWTSDPAAASVHVGAAVGGPGGHASYAGGASGTVTSIDNYAISHIIFCFAAPVEPETQTITFNKVWAGDSIEDQDVEVIFNVLIGGEGFFLGEGEESHPFPIDVAWEYGGEELVGFPYETCSYQSAMSGEGNARVITNTVECDKVTPAPITITLFKLWFDADGELLTEAPDVDWAVELFIGADTESSAMIPNGSADAEMNLLVGDDGEPAAARYGVQESGASGYDVVACNEMNFDFTGLDFGEEEVANTGVGPFGSFFSGVHLVCNQEEEQGEPVITLTVSKEWVGSSEDLGGVSATLLVGGEETAWDAPVVVEAGSTVTLSETVVGLDEDLCSWAGNLPETFLVPTGQMTDTDYLIEAVNVVACGTDSTTILPGETIVEEVIVEVPGETIVEEVIVEVPGETIVEEVIVEVPGETIVEEVIVEIEVLPEVIEAEPEAEPVVVAPEVVEVRGVTVTRAVPTSIDTGTGGYLPSSTPTAALLLLLLGGLALAGGATASLVRRRG